MAAQIAHGEDGDELERDVNPSEDDLEQVEIDSKFLHAHSQTVVGETSGKP